MDNYDYLLSKVPPYVSHVTEVLEKAGYEAYLVGGCVRDLVMDKKPKDWDITTNATPEQIIALFEKTVYENNFGTVGICVPYETKKRDMVDVSRENRSISDISDNKDVSHETPEYVIIEVTPYRTETTYSNFRHPDEVKFSDKIEDDLKRRDFTVNSLALNSKGHLIDLFGGLKDIKDKTLNAVGKPEDRFSEDALRMLRAVRFACELEFTIAYEVSESITKNAYLIKQISGERMRDELSKVVMSKNPASGFVMLEKLGLLEHMIPEFLEGIGCDQSGEHIYDVWNHLLMAMQHAADKGWPLQIRLSALFHDIGKPRTRRLAEAGSGKKKYTFYGHEVVGARMTKKIMERLKFSKKDIDFVEKMVRNHMFFSDTEQITLSAVRRIIAKVGKEDVWALMNVRECDRVGMKKKEAPYRLRKYFAMIEEALRDPISVGALKINGEYLIKELGIKPGPRMGWILHALLEEVLEDPKKNTEEKLSGMVKELDQLSDAELKALGEKAKEKKEELEEKEVAKLHQKHGVR